MRTPVSSIRIPLQSRRKSFTLVEALLMTTAVGIVLALMLPPAIKKRRAEHARECSRRLTRLDHAKNDWNSRDYSSRSGVPMWEDLIPAYLDEKLECPTGAEFIIGPADEPAGCSSSLPGHASRAPNQGVTRSSLPPRTTVTPIPE